MDTRVTLLRESMPVTEMAERAISLVLNGEVDPITAHINICRMEKAIKLYKENADVQDITLRELSKYGKSHQFGDCRLEVAESGVKFDYSMCGDSERADKYALLKALKADIKVLEKRLQKLPRTGMADPETGEVHYPPARSSKTIIRTTFKK